METHTINYRSKTEITKKETRKKNNSNMDYKNKNIHTLYQETNNILRFFEKSNLAHHSKQDFIIISGHSQVMLSAPHNIEQTRQGQIKYSEPDTGVLALSLGLINDVNFAIKFRNDNNDANWDENSLYRSTVVEYIKNNNIKMLFDLHQLSPAREQDIIIGTGGGNNTFGYQYLVPYIEKCFKDENLSHIAVDEIHSATYKYTVSAFVSHKLEIPCFQIEMNSSLFDENNSRYNIEGIVNALTNVVKLAETEVIKTA